jgi:hypothetical protein
MLTTENRHHSKAVFSILLGLFMGINAMACAARIHDITTDMQNPPEFVDVRELRKNAPNPPEYGGEQVAKEQRIAYPDIQPLLLNEPPSAVFPWALAAAKDMGWTIVAAAPAEGRIEATATTLIFRFKDDIVVRIREDKGGSRVDVRSKSRLGKGDLGANAKRIRAYLARLTSNAKKTPAQDTGAK